ncbi:glutamine synthetase family protein [Ancylobacter sp. Lp-2]|uniref:glutamine synthetase family protein n=1 Tax=Ancylobacter sp. Lp-2 TaxID=2881339 RepID=UPI001E466B10|nr:glutamine synthetase family protein [Ancylobacter sp. Lp-2]MCB4768594.1 glutamine synthetase family protein [Ancylobacter sp. Lp-2]
MPADAVSPVPPSFVLAAHCDLNGIFRGKRVRADAAGKLAKAGIRMPMSSIGVDIWGTDVIGNSLFDRGDLDGIVEPTGRGPLPLTWTDTPARLLPMWMRLETGEPFFGDPRRVLAEIAGRFAARGLTPVAATELEFYLVDPKAARARPLVPLPEAHDGAGDTIYCLQELANVGPFLDDVYAMAEACGVAVDAAISESGPGQYEFNLVHGPDVLRIADDTVFFKQIVKNVARRHGLAASFMAKPYPNHSGNGLHVHFSLVDAEGRNVFDDGGPRGTATMHHAVAGLLEAMHDTTLIFAPHRNSARRLRPGTLAPTIAAWGYENRTAAVRIPGGPPLARRIEHRVAGADANPYLVIAAILAAALDGIEAGAEPPAPMQGNVYKAAGRAIPPDWRQAIEVFEASALVARLFPADFITMFATCKQQELAVFEAEISELEYRSYLHSV